MLKTAPLSPHAMIRPTPDGRRLQRRDGTPFLYLADTAWELFHRLTLNEARLYLADRAHKGFTVIQAVLLAELDGLQTPNAQGDLPLHELDPRRPNEAYFAHVDAVIATGAALGLVFALVPTWGDKVTRAHGVGPEIFDVERAHAYGRWVGQRYRDADVIWINGGDRPPTGAEPVWRALAAGLREGDGGLHPITFHGCDGPDRRSSSAFFPPDEPWLDFNFAYSGHFWGKASHAIIARDRALEPRKPVLDGEPRYENHPYVDEFDTIFMRPDRWDGVTRGNSWQVRQAAYWAVFAGAAGHTYGCHDVWQFWTPRRHGITHPTTHWIDALQFHGAWQMGFLRHLLEARSWATLVPDPALLVTPVADAASHVECCRDEHGRCLLAYLARGGRVTVNATGLRTAGAIERWFDPRTGRWSATAPAVRCSDALVCTAPTSGEMQDWVLVLDATDAGLPTVDSTLELPALHRAK